ncbi:MAG TPA: polysaccharide deacetylase family protein [Clostridia bacterium]|nr:polysaccharide deacetylase family protein [Clostridia bacterium]HRU85030.1 polysaccharide deacetylase family protein [Eubacteriales bacterium]
MFIVLKKRNLLIVLLVLLATVALLPGVYYTDAAEVYFGGTARKLPVYGVDTPERVIALTFDAAWGADKTLEILKILKEYDADATFFLVGFWIEKYPELVVKIAEAGLEIGNHSQNHLNMPRLNAVEQKKEIESVNVQIEALTKRHPLFFRAPFGDYNDKLMTTIEELGMIGIQWSIDTLDWKGLSATEIERRVVPRAKNGDIVLMHNNSDHILEALQLILMGLKNKGFKFVSLDELVMRENYYIDHNGIQRAR